MKPTIQLLFISMLSVVSSAQAGFIPLLDSHLINQSLYASSYITMGARTTVGGNIQSATAITLAANAAVKGNVEAGTAVTLGADASVGGYIKAGTTVTLGAGSISRGDIDAGTTTTIGAGVQIGGVKTANSSKIVPPSPVVKNQKDLIASAQTTLKAMGTGTELVWDFGVNDQTLEAGIYSTIDHLTMSASRTLTLDGKGVDGVWLFNISNNLTFAADAKVILKDVTDNSSILWNVLGDGTAGNTTLGARAEARGYIFSKGFVQTGANSRITGIGNDCGGAFSATNFIEFGADSVIGVDGCTNEAAITSKVPEPTSIWLFGLGLIGLARIAKRKKA
ncbi:ice-binding family protein [Neptunomonas antarctica]|uniref:PEP-CTERM protein-sorting domain-containing protein n=1 Tax=Neptunomonas antarctica TaxID=619304 RepID=A0A1N7J051_9GAMM|nr:ice-binding family protein [Neptunomonas antarctica]SIS42626.1 PEP-CTERM protein-sorting domain-containing protein [Neptunomonas antarctica]